MITRVMKKLNIAQKSKKDYIRRFDIEHGENIVNSDDAVIIIKRRNELMAMKQDNSDVVIEGSD